jgi:ABC-type nitrate/sulfonate/bicarbonate transport system permease component
LVFPVVELLRPIPPIAWIPIVVMWFGIGELSKVLVIAYGAFFPILLHTVVGFADVEPIHLHAIATFGASRWQRFRYVYLPSAFPHIVLGLRLGVGMAFIVLVAAELIASNSGLGFLINNASQNFDSSQAIVGMIFIGLIGYLLNELLQLLERRVVRWKAIR